MTSQSVPTRPVLIDQDMTSANFSERDFRDALGMFATGVSIVTADCGGERVAATIGSFSSVSLDPPLVLFMIAKSSRAFSAWSSVGQFAINILDRAQGELSTKFAKALTNKWENVHPLPGAVTDSYLLPGALAWFECEKYCQFDGGDHLIILGKVQAIARRSGANATPLVFFNGHYRSLMPLELDNMPHEESMWIYGW